MNHPQQTVWNQVRNQLLATIRARLGAHASYAEDVLSEVSLYVAERAKDNTLPTDLLYLECWLMRLARSRAIDQLRRIDPTVSLHTDEGDPGFVIEPLARPERLSMSPENEQAVREGFERIRQHEGITPRDWSIFYLFQLRHRVEHTPELRAYQVREYFNNHPHYRCFTPVRSNMEVNRVSFRVQNALNAQLNLASTHMSETSFRYLALLVRDYITSRHNKAPQEQGQ